MTVPVSGVDQSGSWGACGGRPGACAMAAPVRLWGGSARERQAKAVVLQAIVVSGSGRIRSSRKERSECNSRLTPQLLSGGVLTRTWKPRREERRACRRCCRAGSQQTQHSMGTARRARGGHRHRPRPYRHRGCAGGLWPTASRPSLTATRTRRRVPFLRRHTVRPLHGAGSTSGGVALQPVGHSRRRFVSRRFGASSDRNPQ